MKDAGSHASYLGVRGVRFVAHPQERDALLRIARTVSSAMRLPIVEAFIAHGTHTNRFIRTIGVAISHEMMPLQL